MIVRRLSLLPILIALVLPWALVSTAAAAGDVTPPQVSVSLPAYVTADQASVTLDLSDPESGVADIRLSNDAGASWGEWTALPVAEPGALPQIAWTLLPGLGVRTVTVEARNGDGLTATFTASTTRLLPSSFTFAASAATVTYGGTVTLNAAFAPAAPVALKLLRQRAGETDWTEIRTVTTPAAGRSAFRVTPRMTTTYKVVYAGSASVAPAEAQVIVRVRPRIVAHFPIGISSVWLGDSIYLRGTVEPALPGAEVLIERRKDGVWASFMTAKLRADSTLRLAWKPDAYGISNLRIRMASDEAFASGASARQRVIVNRPNRFKVPLIYPHYIVQVVHEYHTYYYEHGVLVRRFNVAFGRPGYPTPLGFFSVRVKQKPAGGPSGACIMYYYGSIGIHGTNEPYLLSRFPRNFSHGCTRMYNKQALWLYSKCPKGTRIHNFS